MSETLFPEAPVSLFAEREKLFAGASGRRAGRLFKLADAEGGRPERLALTEPAEAAVDRARMAVTLTVSTQAEDRSRDVVVTRGIDLANHAKNPVVLFEHGWACRYPIGKAEDPDGAYTVKAGDGVLEATTYFSRKLLEAEQVFELIDEKILRGASIGFIPKKVKSRPNPEAEVNPFAWPGLIIEESELFEYSHVAVPDNPDAVLSALGKGRAAGRPLAPAVRKALRALAPAPRPRIVPGGYQPPEPEPEPETQPEAPTMGKSTGASPNGKPAKKTPPARTKQMPEDDELLDEEELALDDEPAPEEPAPEGEPGETGPELPMGAQALTGLYDRLVDLGEYIEDVSQRQENPSVAGVLEEMAGEAEELAARVAEAFSEEYPELDPLDDSADSEPPAEGGEAAGEQKSRKGKGDSPARRRLRKRLEALRKKRAAAAEQTKRLSKASRGVILDAAEDMEEMAGEENISKGQKTRLKYHSSALRGVAKQSDAEEEEGDGEQMKALLAKLNKLEDIARRQAKALRRARAGM